MSASIQPILAAFRRQMVLVRLVQVVVLGFFAAGTISLALLSEPARRAVFIGLLVLVVCWIWLSLRSVRVVRQVRAGGVLLSIGRLDDAQTWLRKGMNTFSLSPTDKLMAGHLFGLVLSRQGAHTEVIELCRTLLRQRSTRRGRLGDEIRLLLADSLLKLGSLFEVEQILNRLAQAPLPLELQMRRLPIALRYHLEADEAEEATQELKAKVRIAELLDARRAALAHALLAEACRRAGKVKEQAFLGARAAVYHDLQSLAETWPAIAPIAALNSADPSAGHPDSYPPGSPADNPPER
jgi:hypothetical protein